MFMAGPKSWLEATRFVHRKVYTSEAEIAEKNNKPQVLEKKVYLFADTFT